MPTEVPQRKTATSKPQPTTTTDATGVGSSQYPPPQRTDPLPCPRCNSTSTKFCYYNNYNLSQPRYFCKSCRRYWTHGGALRNVPVGGGSRKSSTFKRQRSAQSTSTTVTATSNVCSSANSPSSNSTVTHESGPGSESKSGPGHQPLKPGNVTNGFPGFGVANELDLNESCYNNISVPGPGRFSTLLNMQPAPGSTGLVNFQGGFGFGFEDLGLAFGPNRVWPYPLPSHEAGGFFFASGGGLNENNTTTSGGAVDGCTLGCNTENQNGETWQVGDGENVGGIEGASDCYNWPGLVMSTPSSTNAVRKSLE